ncbi:MAG: aminomethyl-transferring glycine dehydrogenase [Bacteroidales bacterium]|nr:aminomethyl-transferring glycine dehydrogenase [Bacteroidales bacterium]
MARSFTERHMGPRPEQIQEMLQFVGVESMEELIEKTVPANIRMKEPLPLEEGLSEYEFTKHLKAMAAKNLPFRSLIGMGYYGTASFPVVLRNIFENPAWYTSYTPYQSEISQGRLQALFNYQTMICSLTGFNLSNSSLLDESTAAAEAMRMMQDLRPRAFVKEGRNAVLVDKNVFPQTLAVIETRALGLGIEVIPEDLESNPLDALEKHASRIFGVVVQYPGADGKICDHSALCKEAHEKQLMVTAVCDLLSLAVLKEPAAWGADIAAGCAQRFGLPMGFGGPTAGYIACDEKYRRNLPGRIVGLSVDRLGNQAYRLALQTREQHIKRERATSNICTATALMATMAGMYAVYHGSDGIKNIAQNGRNYAHAAAQAFTKQGITIKHKHFFDTIEVTGVDTERIRAAAEASMINFFYPNKDTVRISFDELTTPAELKEVLRVFDIDIEGELPALQIPAFMEREQAALREPIFNTYHSETEMMRYIKMLETRDISLAHSMIPLGSCTMKLNAAAEMMPLSWSEWNSIHPFAPSWQVEGYLQLIKELEHQLSVITGLDACSLQPNSGASGEHAGLMVIRAYQKAQGEEHRNIALIPSSAHGTNPASAIMAGLKVVIVACDEQGNVDVEDLRKKAEEHKENLSCIMITYPSTHGVYESAICEITETIHRNGGLVYMDGANMNAQTGITNPGITGADVCHLNLHKTFAMPHGGGGPGVGPICCTKALEPYLPGHPLVDCGGGNTVAGSPYGSPLLLPITYGYITMLGREGVKRASEYAILNANYLSRKLAGKYTTLYTGENGYVAHECIIDLRHFAKTYGVDATDVAKRLMDYGFHAPTLSFPVYETLMIEPTESESKEELDRFAEAMLSIMEECEGLARKDLSYGTEEDNLLKNAPHTAAEATGNEWTHPYSREKAVYPLPWIAQHKFWPIVTRVDNAYGDRNLVCCNLMDE